MDVVIAGDFLGQSNEWWSSFGSFATVVGVLVALGSVAWSVWLDRSTAERAEAAARLTADNTTRIVEALETMASAAPAAGVAAPRPVPRVRWTLSHANRSAYMLDNVGDAPAYSVTVSSDPTLQLHDAPQSTTIGANEGARFLATPTFGTKDMTITVKWSNVEGGEPTETWRYPLPYRPS